MGVNLLAEDLDHVLRHTDAIWEDLRGARLFITGGTGFMGTWLLESFAWACNAFELNAHATVLTRDPSAFARKAPHLASDPRITLHVGDIRAFDYPSGAFTHIIHGATDVNTAMYQEQPDLVMDTIVQGTRRTLDLAAAVGASRFLLLSSGAAYGRQPEDLIHIPESYAGAPDTTDPAASYGEGKRMAELLCAVASRSHGIGTTIARCFAFVGPYLRLDGTYAVGNFMRDAMRGETIIVNGDGTPLRSYLHAADLSVWLWTMLLRAPISRIFNVGSGDAVSISDLAETVREAADGAMDIVLAREPEPGKKPPRYVPSVERAQSELGLSVKILLPDAIRRTIAWHRLRGI